MKYCTNCGSQLSDSDKFCSACGRSVDNSSTNDTIKADLKVELTNTSTDKAIKAVGSSISSGKKAVKKGTKATLKIITALIIPLLIIAIPIGWYVYSNYLEEQKAQKLRSDRYELFKLECTVKQIDFKESISNEKAMCVYKQFKAYPYLDYDQTWKEIKRDCSLNYIEVDSWQDWYAEGMSCSEFEYLLDE